MTGTGFSSYLSAAALNKFKPIKLKGTLALTFPCYEYGYFNELKLGYKKQIGSLDTRMHFVFEIIIQ